MNAQNKPVSVNNLPPMPTLQQEPVNNSSSYSPVMNPLPWSKTFDKKAENLKKNVNKWRLVATVFSGFTLAVGGAVFVLNFALLIKVVSIVSRLHLGISFSLPTFAYLLSVLLGFSIAAILIYQSLSGVCKREVSEIENSKKHMFRSRFCLWVLAGLCISKLLVDFYVLSTLANEIKLNIERLPRAVEDYNSGEAGTKIGLIYNNGTVLFVPENSPCIHKGNSRKTPTKYYSNERRRVLDTIEVTDDNYYGGAKYCPEEHYVIVNVDILHDKIERILLTLLAVSYALLFLLLAGGCWLVVYGNQKYYIACVEYERNKPVEDMPQFDGSMRIENVPSPVTPRDFEQLDSSTSQ